MVAVERAFLDADEKLFLSHGYCHSTGDWRKEVHAVAVPIRQNRGDEGVAINCTMSAYRLRKDTLRREVAPRLLEAVLHIEQSCGLH